MRKASEPKPPREADGSLHPAARKLLASLAQHFPARFTWGQAATLAGLKPSGGHFNAGRKQLRDDGLIVETPDGLIEASDFGMKAAGEVPPTPTTPQEWLELWCSRLPSPAPDMLKALADGGSRWVALVDLALALGKQATGGHWNSGIATLRNNGLVEVDGQKRMRIALLLRAVSVS